VSAHPVLVEAVRGGHVESVHRGSLVVLGGGTIQVGDVDTEVFPRSALKPLQAVAMLENGFVGRGESLAIAVASHEGEPMHLAAARASLAEAGLDEAALQCPPALPGAESALIEWVRNGGSAAAICHNCSGKHAAMLSTCVAVGWDSASYLDPSHPLQTAIRETIETLTHVPVSATVIDGCGAPAHAVTLRGLAMSFAALATANSGSRAMVAAAMRRYPELIGGSAHFASQAMRAVPGLICKNGAEGVWAGALPDGRAFAAKVDDGAERALPAVLAAVVAHWGFEDSGTWGTVPVRGGGEVVGTLRPSEELRFALASGANSL
jgi:L-asparaginase II